MWLWKRRGIDTMVHVDRYRSILMTWISSLDYLDGLKVTMKDQNVWYQSIVYELSEKSSSQVLFLILWNRNNSPLLFYC